MGLRDLIRRASGREAAAPDEDKGLGFVAVEDADGFNLVMDAEEFAMLKRNEGSHAALDQLVLLSILAEQGDAEELPNGYLLPDETVAALAEEEASVLNLPKTFDGDFSTHIDGRTGHGFGIRVRVKVGEHPQPWSRSGAILRVGSDQEFRLTTPALRVVQALDEYDALPEEERTEAANTALIARLKQAKNLAIERSGETYEKPFDLDLGHFEKLSVTTPEKVGLVVDRQDDGSLRVSPDIGIEPEALDARLHHFDSGRSDAVIRVGNQLIALDEKRRAGVEDVVTHRHIPKEDVPSFLANPAAFYDADLVDVELRFGVRVRGVGVVVPVDFSEEVDSVIDWFSGDGGILPSQVMFSAVESLDELEGLEERLDESWEKGDAAILVDDEAFNISDEPRVRAELESKRKALVEESRRGDPQGRGAHDDGGRAEEKVSVGVVLDEHDVDADRLRQGAGPAASKRAIDLSGAKRTPYPHQQEGIEWLLGLMAESLDGAMDDAGRVQGAILADDMGLGKTFMTLIALREFANEQRSRGGEPLPTLAVLPLSLIENWEAEIAKTFDTSPFEDVVVLQSARDLNAFRVNGRGKETQALQSSIGEDGLVDMSAIRFSLKVGETYGRTRLDLTGRLVLTTYQGLRDYQLSFAQVDWGCVIFDEAQNIKSPDALVTSAAKALKARFKLLATGTPVENSLRDLWCLMDTAQPGLLGSYPQFKAAWMSDDALASPDNGRNLRSRIGRFMLRRVKEDHLTNLPPKTVHSGIPGIDRHVDPELAVEMPTVQKDAYDSYLAAISPGTTGMSRMSALSVLQNLRLTSLHPHRGKHVSSSVLWAEESARMVALLTVLDRVRESSEKAVVFVIDKQVQRKLVTVLSERYGIFASVVNGETKAGAAAGSKTRLGLIKKFQEAPGFNVIIMSPVAAGVGLTITEANHAIHLERHWNPAKEAQATDRIYRIGQTKPVHVYMPIATHPDTESFDVHLDQLLRNKTEVKDAVVVPEGVEDQMASAFGLL